MRKGRAGSAAPARWGLSPNRKAMPREQSYILAFAGLTILAWQTGFGTLALMPFTLLATWFHEMAHGLSAIALGAEFHRLVIFANGSGFAEFSGSIGHLGQAAIAAAGLLGPSVAGCLLIVASRSRRATQLALLVLASALAISTAVWVRSVAGWVVLPLFAAAASYIALRGSAKWQRITAEFLGVQGVVSVYQDLGYLFSPGGTVGGMSARSDTGLIADALFLPYWFWGGLITLTILVMVWLSLRFASRY